VTGTEKSAVDKRKKWCQNKHTCSI